MGLDERLFGWISDRLRSTTSSTQRAARARAAAGEPQLRRLQHLASALAGTDLDARLIDGPGGVAGCHLLVPRFVDTAATPAENEQLLVLFAAFAGFSLRKRSPVDDDDATAQLRRLVRVRACDAALDEELPRLAELRSSSAPALLAAIPNPGSARNRAAALNLLARARLHAADLPAHLAEAAPAVAAFVERAVEADDVDDELAARFAALGGTAVFAMPVCWGRCHLSAAAVLAPASSSTALPQGVTTEREGKQRAPVKRRRVLEEKQGAENPLTHSFEKVHTAEEHRGGQKHADGADELQEQGAALDELDLEETVLSSQSVQSVYRAGLPSGDVGDADNMGDHGLRYDEWDCRRQRYLKGYCRVMVRVGDDSVVGGAKLRTRILVNERRAVERTRAAIVHAQSALRWRTRQTDGCDVDIDAAVDRLTFVAAGHEGSDRVYVARRRAAPEVSMLVLLDASLSTDGWVQNQRVLDIERDAAAIVGVALDGLVDEVALAAFHSDTHEHCSFIDLKRFDEPWAVGLSRLAALQPAGHTRIGPAIRHATSLLTATRARRRLLLVLTDGKPSDRDRYEGRHGEGDLRQALREATRDRVDVVALGADPRAVANLRMVFGHRGATTLRCPADIAAAIGDTLARRFAR